MKEKVLVLALATPALAATLAAATPVFASRASAALEAPSQAASSNESNSSLAELQKTFAAGQAALQRGDLDAAESAFRKVLAADASSAAAYANLGVIAMRRQQCDHALALLQKAEKLEPAMAGIRLNIGLVK